MRAKNAIKRLILLCFQSSSTKSYCIIRAELMVQTVNAIFFNPNYVLELRYEGQKCNKISRFIDFSIAVYPEQPVVACRTTEGAMMKLKDEA